MAVACVQVAEPVTVRGHVGIDSLTYAWFRWRREGLLNEIFPHQPDMELPEFLSWHVRPDVETVGCFAGDELVGLAWIYDVANIAGVETAEVGVGFFRNTPLSVWRAAIDRLLRYGFEVRGLAAIHGTSPAPNRAARVLAKYAGMKTVGWLPLRSPWGKKAVDTVFYSMTKEDWNGRT